MSKSRLGNPEAQKKRGTSAKKGRSICGNVIVLTPQNRVGGERVTSGRIGGGGELRYCWGGRGLTTGAGDIRRQAQGKSGGKKTKSIEMEEDLN